MGTASNGEIVKAATGGGGGASTGIAVLGMLPAPIVDAAYTAATIVHTMDIPAGTIQPGDFVRAYALTTKNGLVGSTTFTVRLGTTGTSSDVALFSRASIGAASYNTTVNVAFMALDNTTLAMANTPDIDGMGNSATANEANKTVADLSLNATKLTFAISNPSDLTGIRAIVVTIARQGGSLSATALTGAQIAALLDAQLGSAAWQSGGENNVNADWNAVSGDAQILNKPTLGTAAALNVGAAAGQVVQLDGAGKLPAIDGSQLTNIAASGSQPANIGGVILVETGLSLNDRAYSPTRGTYTAGSPTAAAEVRSYDNDGFIHWVNRRLGAPFHIPVNASISGGTLDNVNELWPVQVAPLDPSPTHVLLCIGGNELRVAANFADADTIVANLKTGFATWLANVQAIGATPIVMEFPTNGEFNKRTGTTDVDGYAINYGTAKWNRFLRRQCELLGIVFIPASAAISRGAFEDCAVVTQAFGATVCTVTHAAHGFATGDAVTIASSSNTNGNFGFSLTVASPVITVINANSYSLVNRGTTPTSGSATALAMRSQTNSKSTTVDGGGAATNDGGIHFNTYGASKVAKYVEPYFKKIFNNEVGRQQTSVADIDNLCTFRGKPAGIFSAAGGTLTNAAGACALGWTLNRTAGNATVTGSLENYTDPDISQYDLAGVYVGGKWQVIDIVAGTSETIVEFTLPGAVPAAHAVSTTYAANDQRIPAVANGFHYTCVVGGASGASAPTWPVRIGERVQDGAAVWECGPGYLASDIAFFTGEYRIDTFSKNALGENDAILAVSFGRFTAGSAASSDTQRITDGVIDSPVTPGLWLEGETGTFKTPAATMAGSTAVYGLRIKIKTAKSAKIALRQVFGRIVNRGD